MDNKSRIIEIKNTSKQFGEFWAIKDINLEVSEGEIFGLLGPNGAGKTTTIKLMSGLLRPTEGKIYLKNYSIEDEPVKAKSTFALLPDVPYLYKKLTGYEFMKFIAMIYRIGQDKLDKKIEDLLRLFNIYEASDDLTESYSHGMRQRLLLASSLLIDPDILILDEPMVGLDPEAVRMVKDIFKTMARENKTIFLSTHTLADAEELCNRIAIIDKGKIVAVGTIEDLKEKAGESSMNLEEIYLSITRKE